MKCKHCGEQIAVPGNSVSYVHVTGKHQINMNTCALSPYGFHAEPEGSACGDHPANPCNGARGMVPNLT